MADSSPELLAARDLQAREEARAAAAKAVRERIEHEHATAAQSTVLAQEVASKATADAAAASASAQAAAIRATIGTLVPNTVAAGGVTPEAGGGTGEAVLLAARALDAAGRHIAQAVVRLPAMPTGATWTVFAGAQRPTVATWRLFQVRLRVVQSAFARASAAFTAAEQISAPADASVRTPVGAAPHLAAGALGPVGVAVSGVGAALDLAAKVASYLTTEFKAGPLTPTGIDDDLLALAVAGRLAGACYPARWSGAGAAAIDALAGLLGPVQALYDDAITARSNAQNLAKTSSQSGQAPSRYAVAADLYAAAIKAFDTLLADLATVDAAGVPFVEKALDERTLAVALDAGGRLLFVRVNQALGGYYTKRNLWTAFGSMPFNVMGGVVASYAAIDADGIVLAAGEAVEHGGYHRVDEVAGSFGKRWGHQD